MKKTKAAWSAGLAACLAMLAMDVLAAETTRYVVLVDGNKQAGHQVVTTGEDGVTHVDFVFKDNGRGPELKETFTLAPDHTLEFTVVKQNAALDGFNQWTLNGVPFSMETRKPVYTIRHGHRYRLKFRNASDDIHPLNLHRHSFELTSVAGKPTSGVIKDVVMLGGYQELAFDFVDDNPGKTLFHCHQQLHMDFGFMALFDYA